jgi:nucleotide-binding universal stress UspA family protein
MMLPDSVETVLVPLDGSEFSRRALPYAALLAARLGATVHLLSAVADEDEVTVREAELAAVEVRGCPVQRTVVVDRDPPGAIHQALKQLGSAVACMATHGRGRSAALVGSVATEVVARGHDPLVLVGPLVGIGPLGADVVTCVDDTPASYALVPVGLSWARMLREPLVLLTVAEPVPPPLDDRPALRAFGPDGDVEAFLEAMAATVRSEAGDVPLRTMPVYDPISPADGVRMYLLDNPAFHLVVSSHARTGLSRIVFGSVAAAIVHHSTAPVLVVPRPDAR